MRAWPKVAMLLFCAGWGANQFVALLPLYRERTGLSGEQAATVFGIYALTVVPSLIVGGPLSDKIGRRSVAVVGALVALAGNLLLAFGGGAYRTLLVGRFLVGLGSGAAFSAGSAWLVDLDPDASAKRATAFMAGGFGAGPLGAGLLAGFGPWPLVSPYVLQGAALLVVLSVAWHAEDTRVAFAPSRTPSAGTLDAWTFVRRVVFVAPWVFAFPSVGFIVLPSLFADSGGATPVFVGLMAASVLFTGAAVARVAARQADRGVAVGLLGGAIGVVLGAWAAATGLRTLAICAAVFLGIGYGWTMTRTFRLVATTASARSRATLVGVTYALTYLGFGAPLVFVRLASMLGATRTLVGFALTAMVLSVFTLERGTQRFGLS